MFRNIAFVLTGLLLWFFPSGPDIKAAQSTIQARATVVSALTVTGTNDLDFGDVTPGVVTTIDGKTSGNAGEWTISGSDSDEVQLNFMTLPGQLSSGLNTMNIDYAGSHGTVQATSTDVLSLAAGATTNLVSGALNVWLGGSVYPAVDQAGGTYSTTIVLEVTLTGN